MGTDWKRKVCCPFILCRYDGIIRFKQLSSWLAVRGERVEEGDAEAPETRENRGGEGSTIEGTA